MMTTKSIETSRKLGEVLATSVNGTQEAAKWHQLDSSDRMPEPDFNALNREFGECTREMKRAYRHGFNHCFRPLERACLNWWVAMGDSAQRNILYHAETTDIAQAWAWHKLTQIEDER